MGEQASASITRHEADVMHSRLILESRTGEDLRVEIRYRPWVILVTYVGTILASCAPLGLVWILSAENPALRASLNGAYWFPPAAFPLVATALLWRPANHEWRRFNSVLQIFELDAERLSWGPTGHEHSVRWSEIYRLHCYEPPDDSLLAIELHDGQQLRPAEVRYWFNLHQVKVRTSAEVVLHPCPPIFGI